jgi:undecaprenyl pyrophosphate phosphatase UppP
LAIYVGLWFAALAVIIRYGQRIVRWLPSARPDQQNQGIDVTPSLLRASIPAVLLALMMLYRLFVMNRGGWVG